MLRNPRVFLLPTAIVVQFELSPPCAAGQIGPHGSRIRKHESRVQWGYTHQLFSASINCAKLRSLNYLGLRLITLTFLALSWTYRNAGKLIIRLFTVNLSLVRFLTLYYGRAEISGIRAYSSIG